MPWKILRHFSFIPHLKWMLRTPNQIWLMHWFIIIKVFMASVACCKFQVNNEISLIINGLILLNRPTRSSLGSPLMKSIHFLRRINMFHLAYLSFQLQLTTMVDNKKTLHHVTIDYFKWKCVTTKHKYIFKTSFWGIVNPLKWRNLHIRCNDLQWIIN